ncbi:hypothetical protein A3K71_05955 [archaeon RBG_16_50_20]|nr:MAG: hypothetical protein A3K71_05955 [archaeon RBG_16_50_20]
MENILHLLNFFLMLITASAPSYLAIKLRTSQFPRLLHLSIGLAVFAFAHSLYHLADYLELSNLADSFFLPLSVIFLVIWGIYYARSGA